MEASYYSILNAEGCVLSGRRQRVSIFLHDIERPMEQRIIAEIFKNNTNIQELGTIYGPAGGLAGFVYKKSIK